MEEEVERVTDLAAPDSVPETTKNKRAKDPKRVAAGCAGAAARKAKMLGALRAAKESPSSSAVPPRERPVFLQSKDQEHAEKRPSSQSRPFAMA